MKNVAVVFLCVSPTPELKAFARRLGKASRFDVFIVADSMRRFNIREFHYKLIQHSDEECIKAGYWHSNISDNATHIKKDPIAYDKFLYHFCEVENNKYDFIWVFEDDVFIPSVHTVVNLNNKYGDYDLVTPNHFLKLDKVPDWHWPDIFLKMQGPYAYSMVCAAGFSKKMLEEVRLFQHERGHLVYIEVMFNTLAYQNHLGLKKFKVIDPLELKSIVWKGEWDMNAFLLLPDSVFHPMKHSEKFASIRETIRKEKQQPTFVPDLNKLPDFITKLL